MISVPYTKKTRVTPCRIRYTDNDLDLGIPAYGYDNDFGDFVRVKSDNEYRPLFVDVPRELFYRMVQIAQESKTEWDAGLAVFEADEYLGELLRG